MRVLLVSQEMPPETAWGGIGTYVDVVGRALVDMGVEVHVLSVVDGQPASTVEAAGVTVHRFPLTRVHGPGRLAPETWRRLWLPAAVARLTTRLDLRPNVIECPEWNAEGLALSLRSRIPLVVRLHSSARQLFPFTHQGKSVLGLDGRLASRLEDISVRRANVVVSTHSNLEEVAAGMHLDPGALHAIPYPVELAPTPPPDAHVRPPRVTFVGRLEPRKGPEILMRAIPRVIACRPETRFAFVGRDGVRSGDPSSSAWLQAEAERLGVAGAVEVLGQLDRPALAAELTRTSVCAFPSRWESFGNVVAEAGVFARPVVVSSIPPFRDLVEDGVTGRIVSTESSDEWSAALLEILDNPEMASAMGTAGAARIASISAPSRVADLVMAAHRHAIERWRRGERAG